MRRRASSRSSAGVFCVFLMNPCTTPIRRLITKNSSRAMRRLGSELRTSHKPVAERPAKRHADRPSELHGREIGADCPAVFRRQPAQPIQHRLRSARRAIENNGYLGQARRIHPFLWPQCIIKDTSGQGDAGPVRPWRSEFPEACPVNHNFPCCRPGNLHRKCGGNLGSIPCCR